MDDPNESNSQQQPPQQPPALANFDATTRNVDDWAEQVRSDIGNQQQEQATGTNAFDWARNIQQQLSAQGQQIRQQAQQLAQHHEVIQRFQQLLEENTQLKEENAMLRKKLDALQNDMNQPKTTCNTEMVVDDEDDSQDAIGKACDKVAAAMATIAQEGSSTKDSIHAHASPLKKVSYASIAKKSSTRSQRRKQRLDNPTEGMIAWATRNFTNTNTEDMDDTHEPVRPRARYDIVYLTSPQRTSHGEARRALAIFNIPQARIIDVHFPIRGIIGLLIHADFKTELLDLLKQAKVNPVDFNPTAPATIINPEYADYTGEQRADKAKELYSNRMLRACARMPKAYLGASILRHFVSLAEDDPHHLDKVVEKQFEIMRPRPTRRERTPLAIPSIEEARRLLSSESNAGMDTNE
ncbi:hypothetical protein O0I10_013120 [Lichtheimia ornata]|uniref:Uncharacterized protein n=1 Tax=Lichtheimia ornata TaxID=688661 RepID=A0AAD7XP26_9FUNG|nr:uncharacterized protein O0I10_013120 [Lichtheimia ornata]KAJ8651364.1 hypothetical protein O0I10_013120 [Lichtheimia ornata]